MRLSSFAGNVTSQHGEDGMLAELFRRLDVRTGWCVEFGAWDGEHLSNTWTLWHEHGWSALLIEGDAHRCRKLTESTASFPAVITKEAFVAPTGPSSLDALLSESSVPTEFDLLSVDIDGDDHHVWAGMQNYRPKVVVIEYNASFGPEVRFVQDPGQHAGSSARSLLDLANDKGYTLMALTDTNLVLLRSDLVADVQLDEIALSDEFNLDMRVLAYSDFSGRHHILQTGKWGFTGITTNCSPVRAKYHAAGKKIYRRLAKFPAVQNAIAKRADPSSYTTR